MSDWIDVKDRLPGVGDDVWVYIKNHSERAIEGIQSTAQLDISDPMHPPRPDNFVWQSLRGSFVTWDDIPFDAVTHWQPLPSPPVVK